MMLPGIKALLPGLLCLVGLPSALVLGACGKEDRAPKNAPVSSAAKASASHPAKVTSKQALSPPPVLQKAKVGAPLEPGEEAPANALEAFEADLEEAKTVLTPFAKGEKDPRAHLEEPVRVNENEKIRFAI